MCFQPLPLALYPDAPVGNGNQRTCWQKRHRGESLQPCTEMAPSNRLANQMLANSGLWPLRERKKATKNESKFYTVAGKHPKTFSPLGSSSKRLTYPTAWLVLVRFQGLVCALGSAPKLSSRLYSPASLELGRISGPSLRASSALFPQN